MLSLLTRLVPFLLAGPVLTAGLPPPQKPAPIPDQLEKRAGAENLHAGLIELPLDHWGTTNETFFNRYWVDDSYWVPGGPVMVFDAGEGDATTGFSSFSLRHQPAHAAANKAMLIIWEHRFYGESFPALPVTTSPEDLSAFYQFHTIDQALEDVAAFARNFSWGPNAVVSPAEVPWVFVGGSYPGARAAWARKRNPEIWYASLASSAVVEVRTNMESYYGSIMEAMRTHGYSACADDMAAMSNWLEVADETAVAEWTLSAGAPEGASLSDAVRIVMLAPFQEWQYEAFGGRGDVSFLCGELETSAGGSGGSVFAALGEGQAIIEYATALRGMQERAQGIEARKASVPIMGRSLHDIHLERRQNQVASCAAFPDQCMTYLTSYSSWPWQICTEFGSLQSAPKAGSGVFPYKYASPEVLQQGWCEEPFGLTEMPKSDLSARYGGWAMEISNTLFVDGELDPWRTIGVQSQLPEAPGRESTKDIPEAGEVMCEKVFGLVVENGTHCPDLGVGWNTTGTEAFALWNAALQKWLPKFEKHSIVVEENWGYGK